MVTHDLVLVETKLAGVQKAEFGTKDVRNKVFMIVALENVYMAKARKEMDISLKLK